jgi:hypothetical protein
MHDSMLINIGQANLKFISNKGVRFLESNFEGMFDERHLKIQRSAVVVKFKYVENIKH